MVEQEHVVQESSLDTFIDKFGGWTEKYLFYNGEVELRYDPKAHVYLLVQGDDLVAQDGVTTVCHIIDKSEALVPWGCKMMALKLMSTAPFMVLPTGEKVFPQIPFSDFETLVLAAKGAHKEKLEEAATVGSAAHNWIESYIKRVLADEGKTRLGDALPTEERAANCVRAALDWMLKHRVRWVCTERKIYSRKHGYAGTMDGLAYVSSCTDRMCCGSEFHDRLSVIDWKSSNQLRLDYLYQTAAYQQAYEEEMGETVEDRWVIRMGKDDGEFEPWHCTRNEYAEDLAGFLLCLSLRRSVASLKCRIKDKTDVLKAEKKARARAEKEATLKKKCKGADKYKGVRAPKCNGGEPCEMCLATYAEAQRRRNES